MALKYDRVFHAAIIPIISFKNPIPSHRTFLVDVFKVSSRQNWVVVTYLIIAVVKSQLTGPGYNFAWLLIGC